MHSWPSLAQPPCLLQGVVGETAVRQLADYYGKSPDQILEEELRNYFLYLKNEKQVSRSTCTQALCGMDERLLWVACGLFTNQFG